MTAEPRSATEATNGTVAGGGAGPLRGVKVLEITKYVQGPVAGLVLASLGAEVTKIELVGRQDAMRSIGAMHGVTLDERGSQWVYAAVNRNKRALALDVTSDAGKRIFHQLIARSDVFLTNLRTDGLERIGADLASVQAINPTIVYAQGGGLGFDGPLANDPCQDTIGMAFGGFMDVTSTNEEPNYPPGSMSDVLTGTNLASAIMAGLLERELHGRGGLVRTSQLQSLLWMQLLPVGMVASIGQRMARFVREDTTPLYSAYPTAEGWIAIAVIHPHQWPPLAKVLGLEWALDDPRFARFAAIEQNKRALAELFEKTFAQRTAREWWAMLREAGVWCAPVNRLEDLPDDPQVLANEYLVTFPDGFTGSPVPFEVNGWRGTRGVAGAYSEHTDEVLAELGLGEDEILELRAAGTVW